MLGKTNYHKHKHHPFLLFSLTFYCWVWHHMVQDIPLVSSNQLSQLCPFGTSWPGYSLWVGWWRRKPWHCANISQQWPKHWYVINTVLTTNCTAPYGLLWWSLTPFQLTPVQLPSALELWRNKICAYSMRKTYSQVISMDSSVTLHFAQWKTCLQRLYQINSQHSIKNIWRLNFFKILYLNHQLVDFYSRKNYINY